jgi:mRNA-degrading endonuclease toxin of MazEF toxin-antitoxin module
MPKTQHIKDFDLWNTQKKLLSETETSPFFKERQVWFCSLGVNIGDEEDGKGTQHERPVLVVKKFNNSIFLALPLSTKLKPNNKFYYKTSVKNRDVSVLISQIRILDAKRLKRKVCFIEKSEFNGILDQITEVNFKNRTDPTEVRSSEP